MDKLNNFAYNFMKFLYDLSETGPEIYEATLCLLQNSLTVSMKAAKEYNSHREDDDENGEDNSTVMIRLITFDLASHYKFEEYATLISCIKDSFMKIHTIVCDAKEEKHIWDEMNEQIKIIKLMLPKKLYKKKDQI